MERLLDVKVGAQSVERFASLVGPERVRELIEKAEELRRFKGRAFWTINSTAVGGGVAEMLRPLLAYVRGLGVDVRWLVIEGDDEFFHITKRLHHALHGSKGDDSPLEENERFAYERTLARNSSELVKRVRSGDFVVLHDPQTAGLAPALLEAGAEVVWRCHIGADHENEEVERGWSFLRPYLKDVPAFIFSREAYIPAECDHGKSTIIQPSIDAFSAKNQEMADETVLAILMQVGLVEGPPPKTSEPVFLLEDGSPGRVERGADLIRLGRAPHRDTPLVLQVSRWDPLKDHLGVMKGFTRMIENHPALDVHLVLAGPNVTAVADDPEGGRVFDEVLSTWRALPHEHRRRIHLAMLPTTDVEENAAIVNALQRHASVVVQKSLHEGFGLTVTEAMWKAKPVLGTAVGGIQDQIQDCVNGRLLKDPSNLEAFAEILYELLHDPEAAESLGRRARESVLEKYLGMRHISEYMELYQRMNGHAE